MPDIRINPRLWSIGRVRIDDERTLTHDPDRGRYDVESVTDEEWVDLQRRRSASRGSVHQTFVVVDEPGPEAERLWIRAGDLLDLSLGDLKEMATDRGLPTYGRKAEIAERIRGYEEALASAGEEPPLG